MPRIKADSGRKPAKRPKRDAPVPNSDSVASEDTSEVQNSPAVSDSIKNGAKSDGESSTQDFNGEMSKLLEIFSSDMNKTLQAKRKKLEQFTQESTRTTTKKVLETNKNQSEERRNLINQFQARFFSMIQQGESELEKIKDSEDKLQKLLVQQQEQQKLLVQQQKQQQQVRIGHSNRIKALKNMSENFCKGMNELEENHIQLYSDVHNDLKKEMALLQKKFLMDTQQQEMVNVRKHLKQLIS